MPKQKLGIIGVGAFGAFMAPHLARHFDLVLHDAQKIPAGLVKKCGARVGNLAETAVCDIVVIAVPIQKMEQTLKSLAPRLKPGTLVVDVASVKVKPARMMKKILPKNVDIIGTHPLFGPQSGKHGIKSLNMAVCAVRGRRATCVRRFCRAKLGLNAIETTAQEHDREAAYVQGLTHLLAKVIVSLDLPHLRFTTKTFDYLMQMVEMVRYDSDELFMAIERENPFSAKAKRAFFTAARRMEKRLSAAPSAHRRR